MLSAALKQTVAACGAGSLVWSDALTLILARESGANLLRYASSTRVRNQELPSTAMSADSV
jgi:hypothetical protein